VDFLSQGFVSGIDFRKLIFETGENLVDIVHDQLLLAVNLNGYPTAD
jgi:hypothetical protein